MKTQYVQEPLFHEHSAECFARNASGALAYTPCRPDGLDRNLRNLNSADLPSVMATYWRNGKTPGLTLVCKQLGRSPRMSFEMCLAQKCDWRCWLCRQSYDLDEADERRVTAALFGLSKDWCPVCVQAMTPKRREKACARLGRIR